MIIDIDPSSGVPVFRQIMDQIRTLISGGHLVSGDDLPPTRALATELGINPMTVSKAYALLERDGVIVRRPGKPSAVADRAEADLASDGIDLLEQSLAEAVRTAHQLEIEPAEAVAVFDRLLNRNPEEPRE